MIRQIISYRLQNARIMLSENSLNVLCLRNFILCLAACLLWIAAGNCFAQEYPLSYYEVIEKRNFFRPKEKTLPNNSRYKTNNKSAKKKNKSLGFILTGIVRVRGKYKAIIEKHSGEGFYVGINESVEDYLVKEINTDSVILEKDNKESVLKLKKANSRNNIILKKGSKNMMPQKEESSPDKTGHTPNILKELRAGRNPVHILGGER